MKKQILLLIMLVSCSWGFSYSQTSTNEIPDQLLDPASKPCSDILIDVYPNLQKQEIMVSLHNYVGTRVTFNLINPKGKIIDTKTIEDNEDKVVIYFSMKRRKKGTYTVKVLNNKLNQMSHLAVYNDD